MKQLIKIYCYTIVLAGLFTITNNNTYAQKIKYKSKIEEIIALDDWEGLKKYVPKKINEYDKVGNTALLWAIRYDKPEIVDYLLENKANPDIGSPIGEAAKEYLAKQGITDVDYLNSPLMVAIDYSSNKRPNKNKIIKSLLNAGANPNAFNSKFISAFQYTLGYNSSAMEMLLEKGANTTYVSPDLGALGESADFYDYFHYGFLGASDGKRKVIDILTQYDALPNDMIPQLMIHLATEYKIYRFYAECRFYENHIKSVTYLMEKDYGIMSIDQFLTIIEIGIYIPNMEPYFGADVQTIKWFIDFINALHKHHKDELTKLFHDGTFIDKVETSPQKETGISANFFKNYLIQLNSSIVNNDKEWLDKYGYKLE
ncbi:ankyrin repeat domain-containing protein [Bacteroidota bacterium]